ncbi:MAG: sensor hybrid histidine kinase [Xanthobacteraceae bacterium]|nr:sensor hybrid histidine kinase [Xanthobacteraceae bacterium]
MILLVLLTASAIGFFSYRSIEALVVPRSLSRVDIEVELMASRLEALVGGARADAVAFRSLIGLDELLQAGFEPGTSPATSSASGMTADQWRERIARRLVAELEAKPAYYQFRIIGIADGGREVIRVDRSIPGGAIRVAADTELQRKGEHGYFRDTIKLASGEVYVSSIELNEENGAIEMPPVPVLRTAVPLYGTSGKLFGVLIIDVDMRGFLEQIRTGTKQSGSVYVINERGDYLVHPDRGQEFGFAFGKPRRIQEDFPGIEPMLAEVDAEPLILTGPGGDRFGVAYASKRLAGGPKVGVAEAVTYEWMQTSSYAARNASLYAGFGAVLFAALLAMWMARSLTLPLKQMTMAVEDFAHGKALRVPVDAPSEVGVLARSFARMAEDADEKNATIRRNTELLDKTITAIADAVLVVDRNGKTVLANPACQALFGSKYDIGTEEWQKIYHRFRPDEVTPFPPEETPIGRALRGENFDNVEIVMRPEGETKAFHIVASGRITRDEFGAQEGAVIVYRDVSDEKETERQFRQSQKMDAIGQLTGGVAHDFNNILTVITGTIEILADAVADRPKLAEIAKMVDEAAQRGAELTSQLLAFARRQPLEPRATDVNGLIVDTARLLRPTLGEHVEIESMLSDEAWPAMIDPSQLSTALINLSINARDAMPNGGKLTIESRNVVLDEAYAAAHSEVTPGAYVMIAVSDTGGGIPAALVDRVFEPFFTTKEVGKGTGLGLSMVYGFVKQSKGHIKIYSEEGVGTTIKLYLPKMSGAADALGLLADAPSIQGGTESILVVEDDTMVRNYVIAQLDSLGYTTHAAANAAEALAMTDDGLQFDLLFTDVIMPGGLNGRQLADEVISRRPSVRVLYTSGYTENAIVHHGRLDRGVALLNKPYRKADLARKVRDVLAVVETSPA